jgi:hypothetical protein
LLALHERNRLAAVRRFAGDHELGPGFLQLRDDLVAHQALVVGNDSRRCGRAAHDQAPATS